MLYLCDANRNHKYPSKFREHGNFQSLYIERFSKIKSLKCKTQTQSQYRLAESKKTSGWFRDVSTNIVYVCIKIKK